MPRMRARSIATLCVFILSLLASAPAHAEQASGSTPSARQSAGKVDGSNGTACAILGTGALRCWGANGYGQLAQGNTANIGDGPGESTVGVNLGAGRTATAVAVGDFHACAILDTGAVRCWGNSDEGQLGQGDTVTIGDNPGESTVAVNLGLGRTATAISAGNSHTCAILDNGALRCWGWNSAGNLGQGNTDHIGDSPGETTVAVDLGVGRSAVAVAAGGVNTCAILDNGALRCWGNGTYGQLGQGNTAAIGDDGVETTVAVDLGVGRTATAVSVGFNYMCVVLDTGTVRCAGRSNLGQLAQGNTDSIGNDGGETTVAVNLGAGRTATAITAAANHACAVLDNGTLRCWGQNTRGQLGQGSVDTIGDGAGETTVAVDLGTGRTAVAASAFGSSVCLSYGDASVRCWGSNTSGQLGQGNTAHWGDDPGESPAGVAAIKLSGPDGDGDGVPDETDQCPTVSGGGTASGCPAATTSDPPPSSPKPQTPAPSTPAPTTPAPTAELTLSGKTLTFAATLRAKPKTKGCPKTAKARITATRKRKRVGRATATLKVKRVPAGCLATGKAKLATAPPAGTKITATVSSPKLKTKTLSVTRR